MNYIAIAVGIMCSLSYLIGLWVGKNKLDGKGADEFCKAIDSVPPADRPQGEWIAKDGVFYCSCCDNDSAGLSEDDVYVYKIPLPNYCKDCGADMRKGAEDDEI